MESAPLGQECPCHGHGPQPIAFARASDIRSLYPVLPEVKDMIRRALLIVVALLLPVLAQAQVKLLRYPTYSKGKVAFSYLGDIWVANENGADVQRLTVNKARDQYPRFSPDGQWIAFSSNREGNYDVYLVPVTGGEPRQLTFNTANDDVVGWTPDGKKIIFSSVRGNGAFPSVAPLWEVSVDGGIERAVDTDWGAYASYSPDGAKLAFTRHPSVWSRKHYRGAYAADLWVEELASKKFTRLGDEDYKGNMFWPMYAHNGEIYFVSNELPNEKGIKPGSPEVMKSVNNIWKISDKGGKPAQVTHHGDGNLFFPSISADGKTIVYEDNFGIWKLDTASGKSTEIRIDVKSDLKDNKTELVTINNEVEGFHISPSNKRAAIVAHREIFTIPTDRGEIQRVSETRGRSRIPAGRPTASGSRTFPTALAARRSSSPTSSARTSKSSAMRIATRTPSSGPRTPSRSCGPAPTTSCGAW